MSIITEPTREQWAELVRRPAFDVTQLFDVVRPIMDAVHTCGDAALREFGSRFDGVELEEFAVSPAEVAEACALVPQELRFRPLFLFQLRILLRLPLRCMSPCCPPYISDDVAFRVYTLFIL